VIGRLFVVEIAFLAFLGYRNVLDSSKYRPYQRLMDGLERLECIATKEKCACGNAWLSLLADVEIVHQTNQSGPVKVGQFGLGSLQWGIVF